jgi:hypothetical protein
MVGNSPPGYTFAYRTTCTACGQRIRLFKDPSGNFVAVNPGPKFENHRTTCVYRAHTNRREFTKARRAAS